MKHRLTQFHKKGFSLIEMLVYIALITVIFLFIINMILSFTGSYKDITALRVADRSGMDAMERMTREIRNATSVTPAQSFFGSSPGILTIVQTSSGVSTTTKFYLQNEVLRVDVNGVYSGPLTLTRAQVTNLTFNLLTSTSSQAVKIDMILNGTSGNVTKTKAYHSTIILKGS